MVGRAERRRIQDDLANLTLSEREANSRKLMRSLYDERVEKSEIEPLPDDLIGWSTGRIVVTGQGDRPGYWKVNNGYSDRSYDVAVESLMGTYARDELASPTASVLCAS